MASDDMFDFKCKLIEEIKLYPVYDKANPDHSCRNKKDAIFEAIRVALGVTGKFYFFILNQTHGNNRKVLIKLVNNCKNNHKYQQKIYLHLADERMRKWKDLVDTFRQKKKSGAEGTTVEERLASWHFYDHMSFMRPHIQSRR